MRTAGNPLKLNPNLDGFKRHRIIMPVYIPNGEGYYKDAFEIFKLSLDSLIATVDYDYVNITIINNGCTEEVDNYILELKEKGLIDLYIIHESNRGKYDTILSAAKGTYEPFITIADADALFSEGWLKEIEDVFRAFPKAGVVCPFPAPHLRFLHTFYTWVKGLFNLHWNKVVDKEDLDAFANSIGISNFFSREEYRRQFYLQKKQRKALVGAGHFVATYRNIVFQKMPTVPTCKGLKGGLINIEKKIDSLGMMRLSLPISKVFHMGNLLEEWMWQRSKLILASSAVKLDEEEIEEVNYTFHFPEVIRHYSMKAILIGGRVLEKISAPKE